MPLIQYTLSMPNVGSWNGKWSGAENLYAVVRSYANSKFGRAKSIRIISKPSYFYSFGDGWGASVAVQGITSKQAKLTRKHSQGFCGYEWMVDSIEHYGKIYADRPEGLQVIDDSIIPCEPATSNHP